MSRPVQPQLLAATPEGIDALRRNDMASFLRAVFEVLHPGVPLVWNPFLDLLCARLEDLAMGKIRKLLITIPPRHLKSEAVSVALSAFFLGHFPSAEVMAVSYGQDLARGFGEMTRRVMLSEFYKRIFETRLINPRQSAHALRTTQGGIRRATSIDGAATGVGSDLTIFDDPQKPGEILSDAVRRGANGAYENTFHSRRNDPAKARTVVVMQRLHENDFIGHLLDLGGDWEVVNLPAIAEEDEVNHFKTFMGPRTYLRRQGEALHPGRVPLVELERIRAEIGEAAFACQYQQRPAPAGGGLVKAAWFKRYREDELSEDFDRIIDSWDSANKTSEWNDYSVCTTWGVQGERLYLLHVHRERLLYPDLKRAVIEQARLHGADVVLIEDQASGTQLIQDLVRDGFTRVKACKPDGDKRMRMAAQTAIIENGFVYIPTDAHWVAEYLHELVVFPNGRYDDQVDSTSQALSWLNNFRVPYQGLLDYYREEAEAAAGIRTPVDLSLTAVRGPPGCTQYSNIEGVMFHSDNEGIFRIPHSDALHILGFPRWSRA